LGFAREGRAGWEICAAAAGHRCRTFFNYRLRTTVCRTTGCFMGLDGVEIVMKVEETFDIAIADSEAEKIVTPKSAASRMLPV
jgi:hypothetical protein